MKAVVGTGVAILIAASGALSQCYIEADLDGSVGDPQPDFIVTTVGQDVPADIWYMGTSYCPCCFIAVFLCDAQHSLEYVSTEFHSPNGGWAFVQPTSPDSAGCILLHGQKFNFEVPMVAPWRFARVSYQAAVDESIAELMLGEGSCILTESISCATAYFDNNGEVLARIQIGDVTATETTSWGSIKTLFR